MESNNSLHKIDTSAQHFLQNYYEDESESDEDMEEELVDQSAYDIFKGRDEGKDSTKNSVWATLSAPLRTGVVDGKKVVFELHTDVTQKPATDRSERLHQRHIITNSDQSNWEVRLRFWMMHFSVARLSSLYLGAFIVMNVVFAGLFYADTMATTILKVVVYVSRQQSYPPLSTRNGLSNHVTIMAVNLKGDKLSTHQL